MDEDLCSRAKFPLAKFPSGNIVIQYTTLFIAILESPILCNGLPTLISIGTLFFSLEKSTHVLGSTNFLSNGPNGKFNSHQCRRITINIKCYIGQLVNLEHTCN